MKHRRIHKSLQDKIETTKVLIVDDHADIRILIREILNDSGITRTFEAADGEQALQFLNGRTEIINLVICDWNMPKLNGLEFFRKIKTFYPDLAFLMLTARSDKNSVLEAKLAGVNAFIRKPFSPDQLDQKLRFLISNIP